MDQIQRLIEQLQSPANHDRYEACEYLRVAPKLPQPALEALWRTTFDSDALVADAARRALALHPGMEAGANGQIAPVVAPLPVVAALPPSREKWRPRSVALIIIGILMIALGAGFCLNIEAAISLLDRNMAPNPQCSWSSTQGSITGSDLENHVRANGEDDWQFQVRFTYTVGGVEHAAQQQLPEDLVLPPDVPKFADVPYLFTACADMPDLVEAGALFRAAHDASEFFSGRPVVVYFNPANRDEAVLVPGLIFGGPMSYGEVMTVGAGVYLPILGIVLCLLGLSNAQADQSSARD